MANINRWIPLNANTMGEEEHDAVCEVMESGQVTMGYECERFENEFAAKVGATHAIFVNSGSSANLLAWFLWKELCKPMRQPEVVVPAVSWGTTYWPILQAGFKLVIVDSLPETLQMDTSALKQAISLDTAAINPVHVLGNAVDMKTVQDAARYHGLLVVEDSCEALGVKWCGQHVGTIGDMGTYSFYFSHHMTTIEGGMLVTENDDYADMARMMRSHGWSRASRRRGEYEAENLWMDPNFLFVTTGFNLRPTEINAAIGRIQLKKLDKFNERRNQIAAWWTASFQNQDVFKTIHTTEHTDIAAFGFPVICRDHNTRNLLKRRLNISGIETRPIVSGNILDHPAMKGVEYKQIGLLEGANEITNCGLLWGLNPTMSDSDVMYVDKIIMEFTRCPGR